MRGALLACVMTCAGCSSAPCAMPIDAATSDAERTCPDVAAAYEGARDRLEQTEGACAYDWGHCPIIVTDEECVRMFAVAPTCGELTSYASTCSRRLP